MGKIIERIKAGFVIVPLVLLILMGIAALIVGIDTDSTDWYAVGMIVLSLISGGAYLVTR